VRFPIPAPGDAYCGSQRIDGGGTSLWASRPHERTATAMNSASVRRSGIPRSLLPVAIGLVAGLGAYLVAAAPPALPAARLLRNC